ncbi:hypothetical protein TWF694_005177 [Orbilia ellipsospora]|uniref:Uncharacterized protein n=1 Tax=Orbilia ellipsospora TaxID=2528407 RepID=A0AAV9WUY9_9PEZI
MPTVEIAVSLAESNPDPTGLLNEQISILLKVLENLASNEDWNHDTINSIKLAIKIVEKWIGIENFDSEKGHLLVSIAVVLQMWSLKQHDEKGINKCIEIADEATRTLSGFHHPKLLFMLNNLRSCQSFSQGCFHHTISARKYDKIIEMLSRALPDEASCVCPLHLDFHETYAFWLVRRARKTRLQPVFQDDFQNAVAVMKLAIERAPDTYPRKDGLYHMLGKAFTDRAMKNKAVDDIDNGVSYLKQSAQLSSKSHTKANNFELIGVLYSHRCRISGSSEDREKAIDAFRRTVQVSENCDCLPSRRVQLGKALAGQLDPLHGVTKETNEALKIFKEVLKLKPEYKPKIYQSPGLGDCYYSRFQSTLKLRHLYKAIAICEYTFDRERERQVTPSAMDYLNCAHWLDIRYDLVNQVSDLDRAITLIEEGRVKHRESNMYGNLTAKHADLLVARFKFDRKRFIKDWENATYLHREAYEFERREGNLIGNRLRRANGLGWHLLVGEDRDLNLTEACNLYEECVSLLGEVATRSLRNPDKQRELSHHSHIPSMAAAVKLRTDNDPAAALKLLEFGRAIITRSLLEFHADTSQLSRLHPSLASKFVWFQQQLSIFGRDSVDGTHDREEIP